MKVIVIPLDFTDFKATKRSLQASGNYQIIDSLLVVEKPLVSMSKDTTPAKVARRSSIPTVESIKEVKEEEVNHRFRSETKNISSTIRTSKKRNTQG